MSQYIIISCILTLYLTIKYNVDKVNDILLSTSYKMKYSITSYSNCHKITNC